MLVQDLMRTPVVSISPQAGLDRALIMMRSKVIRHLPVVDEGALVGIVTDRDLRLAMEELDMKGPDTSPKGLYLPALRKVQEIMVANVVTVEPTAPVNKAVELMKTHKIGALPVVIEDTGVVVGIVTETDLLSLLSKFLNERNA